MAVYTPNYTLGRGKLFFARFNTGTQVPGPRRFLGNCPEFSLTASANNLEHFSSTGGVRQRDASVPLDTTRTAQIVCDDIDLNNLALFFFGTTETFVDAGATVTDELHADVLQGTYVQVGQTLGNPLGARAITTVSVKVGASTKTVNVDYEIDLVLGQVYIIPGGGIANLDDILVTYTRTAASQARMLSGSVPVEGELFFAEDNGTGINRDLLLPWAKISPNGDLAMISDDWRRIPFNLEILTKAGYKDTYISNRAA